MFKRLIKSIFAIFAGQSISIVGNLALVPLFLSRWSVGLYGEWMALYAVVAYLGVADLGMNSAAFNAMTAAYARGDLTHYRQLQASAMVFYIGTASVFSLLFGIATAVLPISAWIGVHYIAPATAAWVIWLLGALILWQMPAGQVSSIYRSTGNLAATEWFSNLQAIALAVVTATVLLLHGGVLELAWWSWAPSVVIATGAWLSLRRNHPNLLPVLSDASLAGVRELLRPSMMFGVIMLSMALILQGPVLFTSKAFGGAAVALLVTTRTLANIVKRVVGTLQVAIWPELTRLDAIGSDAALRLGHRLFATCSTALCAAFSAALWFEGGSVITVWVRGKLTPDIWLLRCFLVALVLQTPWLASSSFMMANNRHRKLASSYLLSAVIGLIAIALLLRPLGLIAVPLGALIGEGLACYHFVIKDACEVIGEQYRKYTLHIWLVVGKIACIAWCGGFLGHTIAFGPPEMRWIEVGALSSAAAILATWRLALHQEDRTRIIHLFNSRLRNQILPVPATL